MMYFFFFLRIAMGVVVHSDEVLLFSVFLIAGVSVSKFDN